MNLANFLTLIRILLIPLFIISLFLRLRFWALGIFTFAALSDIVDGLIARRYRQQTTLGALMDPAADKLLMVSAFVLLPILSRYHFFENMAVFPLWVTMVVLGRDLIIVLGWILSKISKVTVNFAPSLYGKITTFFQAATIIAVLAGLSFAYWLWHLTAWLTIISGIDYLFRGVKDWQKAYARRLGN